MNKHLISPDSSYEVRDAFLTAFQSVSVFQVTYKRELFFMTVDTKRFLFDSFTAPL